MRQIALSRTDLTAVVDDEDYEDLARYRWCEGHKGCAQRTDRSSGRKRTVLMHRQIMGRTPGDGVQVDHWNGDRLDNRKANLREATPLQNSQNRGEGLRVVGGRNTTSRYVGVYWRKDKQMWGAMVKPPGQKQRHLGFFHDEDEAGRVAAQARVELGFATRHQR